MSDAHEFQINQFMDHEFYIKKFITKNKVNNLVVHNNSYPVTEDFFKVKFEVRELEKSHCEYCGEKLIFCRLQLKSNREVKMF